MKFSRKPPESWFWSHDIEPDHIDDVLLPGMHLARLSVYGGGKNRRFAAISFRESGIESIYLQDIAAAELDSKIADIQAYPLSITADEVNGQPYFSLVLQKGSAPKTSVHTELDETGLSRLIDDQHRISDFTTYVAGGIRKYAAIVEERSGPSSVFIHVTAKELDTKLREHNVTPVRLRGFSESGVRYFTAVAERLDVGNWAWYDDIDVIPLPANSIQTTPTLSIWKPIAMSKACAIRWSCIVSVTDTEINTCRHSIHPPADRWVAGSISHDPIPSCKQIPAAASKSTRIPDCLQQILAHHSD